MGSCWGGMLSIDWGGMVCEWSVYGVEDPSGFSADECSSILEVSAFMGYIYIINIKLHLSQQCWKIFQRQISSRDVKTKNPSTKLRKAQWVPSS